MLNLVVRKETARNYKVKSSKSCTVFVTDLWIGPSLLLFGGGYFLENEFKFLFAYGMIGMVNIINNFRTDSRRLELTRTSHTATVLTL